MTKKRINYTHWLRIRISKGTNKLINQVSKDREMTKSEMIRELIRNSMKVYDKIQ